MGSLFAVLTGGATGLLGTVITKIFGIFETKQKMAEKALDYQHELALVEAQSKARATEMENEAAIAETNASAMIRAKSYDYDAAGAEPHTWVTDVIRLTRPALTFMLVIFSGLIVAFNGSDHALLATVVDQVLYLTATAVTWWFGDRAPNMKKTVK